MKIAKTKIASHLLSLILKIDLIVMLSDWSPTIQNSPLLFNSTEHIKNFIKSHSGCVPFRVPFLIPVAEGNSHLF